MKAKLFILLTASFLLLLSLSPDKPLKDAVNCKDVEKSLSKIKDNLYAGKYEVSNFLYRQFLQDLANSKRIELFNKVQVDSINWRDNMAYNEPYVTYYFRHPAYNNYPVVNVSFEAAIAYCEWLTTKYNSFPERKFKKVIFRLPAGSEWEFAAKGGLEKNSYAWGNRLIENDQLKCNYFRIGDENLKRDSTTGKIIIDKGPWLQNDHAEITSPVDSYWPNKYGMFNVCGNVAEMVQEKGISMGGSWKCPGGEVKVTSRARYSKSSTDLGFRYFMEVLEK